MPDRADVVVCDLHFKVLSAANAQTMMCWRYAPPYSIYDLDPQDPVILAALLEPANKYHAILRGQEMIGFFCLGPDARVTGGSYDESYLDLGLGLRPDLTGSGQGHVYLDAILSFIEEQRLGKPLRATIVGWNWRAIRLCQRAGFRVSERFVSQRDDRTQEFVVLLKAGDDRRASC